MEFLQLMANSGLKSCFTTITILLVIINHKHVGVCQSLCLTGTYLGTLSDGSKDCLFCRDNCEIGYEKVEDCKAESDIKCRKCSNGTFYNKQDMTCRNCTDCEFKTKENCTLLTDTVCGNNTVPESDDEKDNIWLMLVGVAAACVFAIIIIIIIVTLLWWCRHRRRKNNLTSHTVEMTFASHTHEENDVNTSLLNREQCVKTQTSTITEAHNTTGEAIEDTNKELGIGEENNGSEIKKSSHQVSSEPKSNQSSDFFKTVAGHTLKTLASNDPLTASQLGRL